MRFECVVIDAYLGLEVWRELKLHRSVPTIGIDAVWADVGTSGTFVQYSSFTFAINDSLGSGGAVPPGPEFPPSINPIGGLLASLQTHGTFVAQ